MGKEQKEKSFPVTLEERLNAVLNVVNMELKSLTLLCLNDSPMVGRDIKSRIREIAGPDIYLPQCNVFSAYCHKSLFPIGAVAEEELVYGDEGRSEIAYRLTAAGRIYGRPIAVVTLSYSVNENISMFDVFGPTNSRSETRSPLVRARILHLLREGALREIDVVRGCGSDKAAVLGHLRALHKIGFIEYRSCGNMADLRGQFYFYWLGKKEDNQTDTFVGNTLEVVQILKKLRFADYLEISKLTGGNATKISTILSNLEKRGFVRRGKWKGGSLLSRASLKEKGKRFLEEVLDPIERVLKGESIVRSENDSISGSAFSVTRDMVRAAIRLHKEHSPFNKKRLREDIYGAIMDYIRSKPYEVPRQEIAVALFLTNSRYFSDLVSNGKLKRIRRGNRTFYASLI